VSVVLPAPNDPFTQQIMWLPVAEE
jgi:hypothetical protein